MNPDYVLVTTEKSGVFFGEMGEDRGKTVLLINARNCVYWSPETKGFLGLASHGPADGSRVGRSVPSLTIYGVTSIARCTKQAVKSWEDEKWS